MPLNKEIKSDQTYPLLNNLNIFLSYKYIPQSAGTVEYTDCITDEL